MHDKLKPCQASLYMYLHASIHTSHVQIIELWENPADFTDKVANEIIWTLAGLLYRAFFEMLILLMLIELSHLQDAHHLIVDDCEIIVDYNRQRLMPGWIPRRLG